MPSSMKMKLLLMSLALSLAVKLKQTHARPTGEGCENMTEDKAKIYLARFGYAGDPTTDAQKAREILRNPVDFSKSILKLQQFFKLEETGTLNTETKCLMNKPRCASPDIEPGREGGPSQRYRIVRAWPRDKADGLSWNVHLYDTDITPDDTDYVFEEALQKWSNAAKICFINNKGAAQYDSDIDIHFVSYYHADITNYTVFDDSFDGPSGVLAHAYYPATGIYGGDAHFDASETWKLDGSGYGFKLDWVALHEFGHSIGIAHTNVYGAIMYPTYPIDDEDTPELYPDDIAAAVSLYGLPEPNYCPNSTIISTAPTPTSTPSISTTTSMNTTTEAPGCNVDAIVEVDPDKTLTIDGDVVRTYDGNLQRWENVSSLQNVLHEINETVLAALGDRSIMSSGENVIFVTAHYIWLYTYEKYAPLENSLRLLRMYRLENVLHGRIYITAGFFDKCWIKARPNGRTRKRRCAFFFSGTEIYQFKYSKSKWQNENRFLRPVFKGVISNTLQSMPLSWINNATYRQVFPSAYIQHGVDSAANLGSLFVFVNKSLSPQYIKMKAKKNNVEHSRGDLESLLQCPYGPQLNNFAAGSDGRNEQDADRSVRRSGTDVLNN